MNHGGWHWAKDLEKNDCNFFYWEAETVGMVKLEFDLPKGVTALNFDTISRLNYDFINYFYGYARTDSTLDKLSGLVTFTKNTDNKITIDGKINIDTENPVTHQEIIFKKYLLNISTLSEAKSLEKSKSEEWKKQIIFDLEVDNFISDERNQFYDSIFNKKLFPDNNLKAKINKSNFDFILNKSYLLRDAKLSSGTKDDLAELLEGNPINVEQGNKNVLVLHCLYDPVKTSVDDETNYSLNIEIDKIIVGKTYRLNKNQNEIAAKLFFWHYGPNGSLISSQESSGTLTIKEDNYSNISGTLNFFFLNTDNTRFNIKGRFELPKIKSSDISNFENQLMLKVLSK